MLSTSTFSVKYEVGFDRLFNGLALARENQEVSCGKLLIQCRQKASDHAVFLISSGYQMVAQFFIPKYSLDPTPAHETAFAKKHVNVKIYAIDMNPDAVSYIKRNIDVNKVQGKVTPILGDAKETIKLKGKADRAIMNLPEKAIEYVDAACEAIKPKGGTIHYYEFSTAQNPMKTAKSRLIKATEKAGRNVEEVLSARIVREAAPFTWQIAVDAEIH